MISVVFVAAGGYVGVRVPENAVGWLIALFGLCVGGYAFFETYALSELPNAEWVMWFASGLWIPPLIVMLVFVPLLFPDGHVPGPRWRWVTWSSVLGGLLLWVGNAFDETLLDDYGLVNPVAATIPVSLIELWRLLGSLLVLLGIVAGLGAAMIRFRRSEGVLRQQMKWFAASTLVLIPALLLQAWAYESGPRDLAPIFMLLGALGILSAVAVAILRYRLYELDRIISRTVSYTLVVVMLGLLFAIGVVVVPNVAMSGETPPWLVAATTLAVAALFNPVRRRIQGWVDRRFNRSRYDAERVMDRFSGSLRDQVDPDQVVNGWVDVVEDTMEPSSLGLWVR
jgi:hypothetical protein